MSRTRSNTQALDAFLARKAEIDTMLGRLAAYSDDHFGVGPDDVNWGHVGTLAHYAELLRRIIEAKSGLTPPGRAGRLGKPRRGGGADGRRRCS